MTSLVWLVFFFFLNHIIHQTMFPTINLRTRIQKKLQYYSVPYGHVLLPSFHPYIHILITSLHHYDVIFFPVLPWLCLSFSSHQKLVNADFCQGEIKDPGNNKIFSYHPLLKTYSNQEQDNSIHYPLLYEIIEEIVE